MNGDPTPLHADTGVTSGLFVERSLNEIRFLGSHHERTFFISSIGILSRRYSTNTNVVPLN